MTLTDSTAVTTESDAAPADKIVDISLREKMSTSFAAYALSVITSRALPDARDGLKPVHRRLVYAMNDQGFRPDRGYVKSARPVAEAMGNYHPHGDTAIYDALVRLAQPWAMRQPLVDGQGNFGSQGDDNAAAMRYTEARLTPLAMELVRDIDEQTVDFQSNYDGKSQEPVVLPARFPNLLVNGSAGIAVAMATNIPTHNLGEVNQAVQWYLANPTATEDALLAQAMGYVQGPDFPTGALIAGRSGVEEYLRTGRGSIRMRAVVEIEEDTRGRNRLVVTEIPYGVNKDALLREIKELVETGRVAGIADLNDEGSVRTGMKLVITLKRDAVAKVVLNNLYKHSRLQTAFGANMVALVDGVPRTLNLAQMIRVWVDHQVQVITRRTAYRLHKAEERDHILQGLLAALDALDQVIALIRASSSTEDARQGLMTLLGVDEVQANAILDMQLRRLAALEAQKITDEHDELQAKIADYTDILGSDERQRAIIGAELAETVDKHALPRATQIVPFEGDLNAEDFIAREDVVITITRSGYAKRTRSDLYRTQRRGGRGVRGAALREDDLVEHFFVASTHDTILFFTNHGKVYRAKAHHLQDAGRDAKGQHLANVLGLEPGETVTQVLDIPNYQAAPYLVLATKHGLVKKTALGEYDTRISGGLIAINLREGDELVSAALCSAADDLLLVTAKGQAARFTATDDIVRPMGRNTAGVTGIRFRDGDRLLSMQVIAAHQAGEVFVATSGGYAKRTPVAEYPVKGRGGLGVVALKTDEGRGDLVGACIVTESDEVFAITSNGGVIRTPVATVRTSGRSTMGVRLINLKDGDAVLSIARNPEVEDPEDSEVGEEDVVGEGAEDKVGGRQVDQPAEDAAQAATA